MHVTKALKVFITKVGVLSNKKYPENMYTNTFCTYGFNFLSFDFLNILKHINVE